MPRPDVELRGFGDGACQFEIGLPDDLTHEQAARLKLRIAESDFFVELPPITGAPEEANAAPAGGPASPVFIVGSPRSGTSILARVLVNAGYHGFEEGNLLGLSQFVEKHVEWFFKVHKGGSPEALLGKVNPSELKDELFAVFKRTVERLNPGELWFDKTGNPEMIGLLPRVMRTWPDSRVIFANGGVSRTSCRGLRNFPV